MRNPSPFQSDQGISNFLNYHTLLSTNLGGGYAVTIKIEEPTLQL